MARRSCRVRRPDHRVPPADPPSGARDHGRRPAGAGHDRRDALPLAGGPRGSAARAARSHGGAGGRRCGGDGPARRGPSPVHLGARGPGRADHPGRGVAAVRVQRAQRRPGRGRLHQRPGGAALLDRLAAARARPRAQRGAVRLSDRPPVGGGDGRRGHQHQPARLVQRAAARDSDPDRAHGPGGDGGSVALQARDRGIADGAALPGGLVPRAERLQGNGDGAARARLRGDSPGPGVPQPQPRLRGRGAPTPRADRRPHPADRRERLRLQHPRARLVRARPADLACARALHGRPADRSRGSADHDETTPPGADRRRCARARRRRFLGVAALGLRQQGRHGAGVGGPAHLARVPGRGARDLARGRLPDRAGRRRRRLPGRRARAAGGRDRCARRLPAPRLGARGHGRQHGDRLHRRPPVRVDLRGGEGPGGDGPPCGDGDPGRPLLAELGSRRRPRAAGRRGTRRPAEEGAAARGSDDRGPVRARRRRRRRARGLDPPGAARGAGRLRPAWGRARAPVGPDPEPARSFTSGSIASPATGSAER